MEKNLIYPQEELQMLARLIQLDVASWRGVSCYSLKPVQGAGTIDVQTLPDKSLCFEGAHGSLIYLGKPIENVTNLPVEVLAIVPDIAASSRLALVLLRGEADAKEVSDVALSPSKSEEPPLSVLLADDDPMTRKLMEGFLAKRVKTLTVENPRKASANYTVHKPDIVFLDIHYKDDAHDGFDVLHNILSVNTNAYVVIISGDGNAATIYKSLKEGARGFIAKPLCAEDFYIHLDRAENTSSHAA